MSEGAENKQSQHYKGTAVKGCRTVRDINHTLI